MASMTMNASISFILILYIICLHKETNATDFTPVRLCWSVFRLESTDAGYSECERSMINIIKTVGEKTDYLAELETLTGYFFEINYVDHILKIFKAEWPAKMMSKLIKEFGYFSQLKKILDDVLKVEVGFWKKFYDTKDENWAITLDLFKGKYVEAVAKDEKFRNALDKFYNLAKKNNEIHECISGIIMGMINMTDYRKFTDEDLIKLYRAAVLAEDDELFWDDVKLGALFKDEKIRNASVNQIEFLLRYGLNLAVGQNYYVEKWQSVWPIDETPFATSMSENKQKWSNEEITNFTKEIKVLKNIIFAKFRLKHYLKVKKTAVDSWLPIEFLHKVMIKSSKFLYTSTQFDDLLHFLIEIYKRNPAQLEQLPNFVDVLFDSELIYYDKRYNPLIALKMAKEKNMNLKQLNTFMIIVGSHHTTYLIVDIYEKLATMFGTNIFETMKNNNMHSEHIYDFIELYNDEELKTGKKFIQSLFNCNTNGHYNCKLIVLEAAIKFNDKLPTKMNEDMSCNLINLICLKEDDNNEILNILKKEDNSDYQKLVSELKTKP